MFKIQFAMLTAGRHPADDKPFDIEVDYRTTSKALPDVDWSRKAFIWLDYDDPLQKPMLDDVRLVASKAKSGSVLSVSVQTMQAAEIAEAEEEQGGLNAIDRLVQRFGRERIKDGVAEDDLYGWPFAALSRSLLLDEIEVALSNRVDKMTVHLVCEIEYSDDAKMTTLSVVFVASGEEDKLASCAFEKLDFIASSSGKLRIEMPKITIRELRFLESQLPLAAGAEINRGVVPISEANKFVGMYRYFPNFGVLEA